MISCGFLRSATGYKKRHGVIFQGTMTPCGLFASVHGSYSGRRNDAFMFRYAIAYFFARFQVQLPVTCV
jgi:hypothetical protein